MDTVSGERTVHYARTTHTHPMLDEMRPKGLHAINVRYCLQLDWRLFSTTFAEQNYCSSWALLSQNNEIFVFYMFCSGVMNGAARTWYHPSYEEEPILRWDLRLPGLREHSLVELDFFGGSRNVLSFENTYKGNSGNSRDGCIDATNKTSCVLYRNEWRLEVRTSESHTSFSFE